MAEAYFDCVPDGDVIEVDFIALNGNRSTFRLFVDSGFTGASSFVLSEDLREFASANLSRAHTTGALRGQQERVLVRCAIPVLSFDRYLAAIVSQIESLSLPSGVQGMAGLTFLRQFSSWGAVRSVPDSWRFFLKTEDE